MFSAVSGSKTKDVSDPNAPIIHRKKTVRTGCFDEDGNNQAAKILNDPAQESQKEVRNACKGAINEGSDI